MGGIVRSVGRAIGGIVDTATDVVSSAVSGFDGGNFLTGVAISVVSGLLSPKPRVPNTSQQSSSYTQEQSARAIMQKTPISSRETVYGNTKKSGSILFMETTNNNKRVHIIIQIASHEIESFDTIYFNDEALTLSSTGNDSNGIARYKPTAPSKYNKASEVDITEQKVRIKQHLGGDNQLADADLVSEVGDWTTDHRLRGIAYLYIRLENDSDMFPNGIPNISAEISGKKLFDFRTSTTAFSKNPALAIYDYLSDSRLGLGVSTSDIDTTSFTTMANLCDENVSLSAGGTEKRYECHGIAFSDISPMEILDNMLTSCLGILSYSNGKFILKGGQYVAPSFSLDEDDFISAVTLTTKQSRKNLYNTVKGVFTSNETNWQPTDYPPVTSSTFTDLDGETITADIDLAFTKSSTMAQRIAKVCLFKNRQQMMISARLRLTAFRLQVGDTVQITNSRLGFSNKIFEVAEWSFTGDNSEVGIDVVLKEMSSSVYDWNAEETSFSLDNTTLPTVQDVQPPSMIVTDELRTFSETPITVLKVECSSSQGTTNEFEVEAQNTDIAGSDYITLGRSKGNIFELVNVEDGSIYNVRARSINSFNVHSDFTTTQHEVIGKTAVPSDVTDFSSNVVNDVVHLAWTPISDLDLSHYIIRHTRETTSPSFEEGRIVAKKVGKPANSIILPAETGTYMIKAIDVLGLESETSAKTVIILNRIREDFNVVATLTEHPNFTGTKEDVEVVDEGGTNKLALIHGQLFDDAVGLFDDNTGLFDGSGTGTPFNLEGTYDFPTTDLGAIYNSRVTVNLEFERHDEASLFDAQLGNFDSRTGLFDGAYTEHNDVNVEVLISTSTDGTTYTAYRSYILGDYKARYIKIRVKLTTEVGTVCPHISLLSATIDMPDRTVAENDIAAGTGGKVVTFSPAFKELQGLGIEVDDLDQNQHYVITNKSATGFTINFYNGSGTGSPISADFSYVAKGYGYVESA